MEESRVPPEAGPSDANAETAQNADGTQNGALPKKKEPERVYEMYSWKVKAPESRLVYIRDTATAELELAKLPPGPLGFDLEWKPIRWKGGYNPVALVQLATPTTILLLQVTAMKSTSFTHSWVTQKTEGQSSAFSQRFLSGSRRCLGTPRI